MLQGLLLRFRNSVLFHPRYRRNYSLQHVSRWFQGVEFKHSISQGAKWIGRHVLVPAAQTVVVYYVVTEYFVEAVLLQGHSMEPCVSDGDCVLAEHISVNFFKDVARRDIVVSKNVRDPKILVCKRVKAVNGDVVRNDDFGAAVQVPDGHVWLEGDNKSVSVDSWEYGSIPFGLVRSRVIFRVWPLHKIGNLSERWFFSRGHMYISDSSSGIDMD